MIVDKKNTKIKIKIKMRTKKKFCVFGGVLLTPISTLKLFSTKCFIKKNSRSLNINSENFREKNSSTKNSE